MTRKKVRSIIMLLFILVILFIVWRRDISIMDDVQANEISKITMYDSSTHIEVTDKEDISKIVNLIQSMELNHAIPKGKEGYAFSINICYKNGEESIITVRSTDIVVDGTYYESSNDYCGDFQQLYNEFESR